MQFHKNHLILYAVTDRAWTYRKTLQEQILDALEGGATMIQLREKNLEYDAFVDEAIQIRKLCHAYHVPLIINDNVDIALKSGADGVHVGITDPAVKTIRAKTGKNFIIGATAKTVEQAKKAEADGANYLGIGAVFPSPTKKSAIRITKEMLHEICSSAAIPAVAIGGIQADNLWELKGSGICGIAAVSAIFAAKDIKSATAELRNTLEKEILI